MILVILRITLAARAVLCVAFVWYFVSEAPRTPVAILTHFATYALADGTLALLAASAAWLAHFRRDVIAVGVVGGVIRIAAGLAIKGGPGIPYFAVTYLLYLGLLATLVFFIGLVELREARRLRHVAGWHGVSVLFAIEGAATVLLGVLAFVLDPEPARVRTFVVAGALLEAIAVLALLMGANPSLRQIPTSNSLLAQSRKAS